MNKINVYVGRNVKKLVFNKGKFTTIKNYGLHYGVVYIEEDSFSCKLPESGLHPTDISLKIINIVANCLNNIDIEIATNSMDVINTLSEIIRANLIKNDDIVINILNDSNEISSIAGFDSQGYLTNWPIGMLSSDFDLISNMIEMRFNRPNSLLETDGYKLSLSK